MTGPAARTPARTPAALLETALSADPGRPLLTWYDDATGERVELSVATTANWVAKAAGLLTDDLDVVPGAAVRLALPRHWLRTVLALAAWRVGAGVDLDQGAPGADVLVVGPDGLDRVGEAPFVLAASLAPMGAPFPPGALPGGVLDLAREVPVHPDRYAGPPPPADGPGLRTGGRTVDAVSVVAEAEGLARSWLLGPGGRLLVLGALDPPTDLLATSLVPLAVGGSVVLVVHGDGADRGRQDARAAAERVTAWAGPAVPTA